MAKKEVAISDSENGIVFGQDELAYSAEQLVMAKGSHEYIKKDVDSIKHNYIKLGFHLAECCRMKYHECFGYSNFYDYVAANFSMDKGATSRCINVFMQFSAVQDGVHKIWIDDKWKDYSYTQLCEMLPMTEEERSTVEPGMTTKAIRELKKSLKESKCGKLKKKEKEDVASTQLCGDENKDEDIRKADSEKYQDVYLPDLFAIRYKCTNLRITPITCNRKYNMDFISFAV